MHRALLAIALALVLAACTAGTSVTEIEVGDCFDDPEGELISNLELLECSDPHDNEVFAEVFIDGVAFPGNDALIEFGFDSCLSEFEAYVGESYAESPLDYSFLYPSEESWSEGDRSFLCYLYSADLSKLTGSARG